MCLHLASENSKSLVLKDKCYIEIFLSTVLSLIYSNLTRIMKIGVKILSTGKVLE